MAKKHEGQTDYGFIGKEASHTRIQDNTDNRTHAEAAKQQAIGHCAVPWSRSLAITGNRARTDEAANPKSPARATTLHNVGRQGHIP
jgi:hypothetical protein